MHHFAKSNDKLCRVPNCIAATMVQEDVPTTLAPTQAPQINDGSDTVQSFKYRQSKDKMIGIANCIAAVMPTPTPTHQINNSSDIVTILVQEEVLTTQVPQTNDGSNTIPSCIIFKFS